MSWDDVTKTDTYQNPPSSNFGAVGNIIEGNPTSKLDWQRNLAGQYFDQKVATSVPSEKLDDYRQQFIEQKVPSPGYVAYKGAEAATSQLGENVSNIASRAWAKGKDFITGSDTAETQLDQEEANPSPEDQKTAELNAEQAQRTATANANNPDIGLGIGQGDFWNFAGRSVPALVMAGPAGEVGEAGAVAAGKLVTTKALPKILESVAGAEVGTQAAVLSSQGDTGENAKTAAWLGPVLGLIGPAVGATSRLGGWVTKQFADLFGNEAVGSSEAMEATLKAVNASRAEKGLDPITSQDFAYSVKAGQEKTENINTKYGTSLAPTTSETIGLSGFKNASDIRAGVEKFQNSNATRIASGRENAPPGTVADVAAMQEKNANEIATIVKGRGPELTDAETGEITRSLTTDRPDLASLNLTAEKMNLGDNTLQIIKQADDAAKAKYDEIPPETETPAANTHDAIGVLGEKPPVGLTNAQFKILTGFADKPVTVQAGDLVNYNIEVSQIQRNILGKDNIPEETKDLVRGIYDGIREDLESSPDEEVASKAQEARDFYKQTQDTVYRQLKEENKPQFDTSTVFGSTKAALAAGKTINTEAIGSDVIKSPENVEDYLRGAEHTGNKAQAVQDVSSAMYADLAEKTKSGITSSNLTAWLKDRDATIDKLPGFDKEAIEDARDVLKQIEQSRALGKTYGNQPLEQTEKELTTAGIAQTATGARSISISNLTRLWQNLTDRAYNKAAAKLISDPEFARTTALAYKSPSERTLTKAIDALNSISGTNAPALALSSHNNNKQDLYQPSPGNQEQGIAPNSPAVTISPGYKGVENVEPQSSNPTNDATRAALAQSKKNLSLADYLNPIGEAEAAEIHQPKTGPLVGKVQDFIHSPQGKALQQSIRKQGQNATEIMAMVDTESSVNKANYRDYGQMTNAAWQQSQKLLGRTLSRNNPKDYADAVVSYYKWTAGQVKKIIGSSGTPSVKDVYIAYNAGIGGFKALINADKSAIAANIVGANTATNNKAFYYSSTGKPLTVAQTIQKYHAVINKKLNEVYPISDNPNSRLTTLALNKARG